jgi:hypothetical protein
VSEPNSQQIERLFEDIRTACPSFVHVDDAGKGEWTDEPHPLDYARMAGLTAHLVALAEAGQIALAQPVFDLAEAALHDGDDLTKDLVVVGLLEQLQADGIRTDGRVRIVDFRAMLKPLSLQAWDELMRFWYGPASEARKRLPPGSLPREDRTGGVSWMRSLIARIVGGR